MDFISVYNILFTILGYQVSLIELIGVITGLMSVFYAVKANVLTWSTGIVNAVAFFILFYQISLYSDMFLQVYFFIISIIGWIKWHKKENDKAISTIDFKRRTFTTIVILAGSLIVAVFMSNIHLILPDLFKQPAAFPFLDSFVLVASIVAVTLMALRKIESWVLWILIDITCVIIYFLKGILFMSIEYGIFLGLATSGLITWVKFYKNEKRVSNR